METFILFTTHERQEIMKTEKEPDNHLAEEVYTKSRLPLKVIIPFLVFIPIVGFLANFPLSSILTDVVSKNLRELHTCPITFEKIETSFFFIPKVIIKNPSVSGICFKMPGQDLKFKDIVITFRGPSFYPPGLKFHAAIEKDKSQLHIYPSISYNRAIIKIADTTIDSAILDSFMNDKGFIKGQFTIEALIDMTMQKVTDAQVLVKSKNLVIPGRNIGGFVFDTLDIGPFILKASKGNTEKIFINELIAGSANGPLSAKFDGDIFTNDYNFSFSNLNLKGELNFSSAIKNNEKYGFLSFLFANYQVKNGAYQIRIGGTLEAPLMTPL